MDRNGFSASVISSCSCKFVIYAISTLLVFNVLPVVAQETLIDWNRGLVAPEHWELLSTANPTGQALGFSLVIVPGARAGGVDRQNWANRYILGINMDVAYTDYDDLIYLKAHAPGSVALSTYDSDAYIEVHDLRYKKDGEDPWLVYSEPTDWEQHEQAVYRKSVEALIGTIPVVGTFYSAADLLYLAFVDQTPDFLISSQLEVPMISGEVTAWDVPPRVRSQNANTLEEVTGYADPSSEFRDVHRYYDVAKKNWDSLATGDDFLATVGVEVEFTLIASTRRLPLFVRAVLPILWKDGSRDSQGRLTTSEHTYFAELEWMTSIPAIQDTSDTGDPESGTTRVDWVGNVVAPPYRVLGGPENIWGKPDNRQMGVQTSPSELIVYDFGAAAGGESTTFETDRLAQALGVTTAELSKADFFAIEHNSTPRSYFESGEWIFNDGTTSCSIMHDFDNPHAGESGMLKAGYMSSDHVRELFGITPRSGAYAFLLFDISTEGLDPYSSDLRVTLKGGSTSTGTPDPDAMGVVRVGPE
jgi:hypothetical protein